MTIEARPFVKWVGGKRALIPVLLDILPKRIRTYYEPFTGGGALFYGLAAAKRFERAVLNDWNAELVAAYKAVRDFPDDLVSTLRTLAEVYQSAPRETYEQWRAKDPTSLDPVVRAARMIFLNRTCFNGLWRVNKAGKFNVPFGKHTNPTICDEVNLRACSAMLEKWSTVRQGDFASACEDAGPGDVVYFDPPYVPLSSSSDFTSYTSDKFGLDAQHRLAALFRALYDRGVSVVLSNSDTKVVRSLYEGFELREVRVRRNINSKGDGRGAVGELIVVGRRATEKSECANAWDTDTCVGDEKGRGRQNEEVVDPMPGPSPEALSRPPFDLEEA